MRHMMQISGISLRTSSPQTQQLWKDARYFLLKSHTMNSEGTIRGKADHITLTSENSRQDLIAPAKITEIKNISRTVKLIHLNIPDIRFCFKAGQWVDMMIPGVDTVGGFSMCSAPDLLSSQRLIHLAVKYSKHPPAFWVHSKCEVGDEVHLRAGGDFFYDAVTPEVQKDLLLLAGGVGINPLYSILLHFNSLQLKAPESHSTLKQVSMLFCARNQDELLFSEDMRQLSQANKNISLKLHCTRENPQTQGNSVITNGRISEKDVQEASSRLCIPQTEVFICGPSTFINTMETYCVNIGIPRTNIHFEKWW